MTTYTISGIAYDYKDTEDHSDDYGTKFYASATLSVVGTASSGFTYDITYKNLSDGVVDVDIDLSSDTYSISLDGMNPRTLDIDATILGLNWTNGSAIFNSVVLELDYGKGDDAEGYYHGTRYYFVLDGFDLPEFSTMAEFNAFANTDDWIKSLYVPGGDFGEGELIRWGDVLSSAIVSQDDDIPGTNGKDVLIGGAGDDYFLSSKGNDTYKGGTGYDQVSFKGDPSGVTANLATGKATDGWGNTDKLLSIEMLRGSAFDDTLIGNRGNNVLRGLAGDDVLNGSKGRHDEVRYDRDESYGGTDGVTVNLKTGKATDGFGDTDTLRNIEDARGSESNDKIIGSKVANEIEGLGGKDVLSGLGGKDTLLGGGGRDRLLGGGGADTLKGEAGIDTLIGGGGNDALYGGGHNDRFVFKGTFGDDTIFDFKTAGTKEKIDLSAVASIKNFTDLSNNHLSEVGGNAVIDDGSGNTITLDGIHMAELSANDFLF